MRGELEAVPCSRLTVLAWIACRSSLRVSGPRRCAHRPGAAAGTHAGELVGRQSPRPHRRHDAAVKILRLLVATPGSGRASTELVATWVSIRWAVRSQRAENRVGSRRFSAG